MKCVLLKYRLEVWKTTVLFQILEQHESQRVRQGESSLYFADAILKVTSADRPEITATRIYLRGLYLQADDRVCSLDFKTPEKAQAYKEKVEATLLSWGKSGGFPNRDKTPTIEHSDGTTTIYA